MPHFLYTLRPTRPAMLTDGPTDAEAASGRRHFEYLERLAREGRVLLFGRTQEDDERTFGVVLLEAEDEAAARESMTNDPGVAEGLMRAELHPFRAAGGKLLD